MKIKFLLGLFLLGLAASYSQKTYEFNYVIEYENSGTGAIDDSKTNNRYLSYQFFNSKDNSYILSVTDDTVTTKMWLILSDGQTFYGDIASEDFFVQGISLKCPKNWKKSNGQYEKLKDYDFVMKEDIFEDSRKYYHYVINPLIKNNKETYYPSPIHYIIDNSLDLSIPVLNPTGLIYRKWKKGDDIPNGIIKESYMVTDNGNVTLTKMLQCVKTQKIIFIDKNCK